MRQNYKKKLFTLIASTIGITGLSLAQVVTTFAGDTLSGLVDGSCSAAKFNYPVGIIADRNGNLFITENNDVRKIDISTATVSTVLRDTGGFGPQSITTDGIGNLYIADQGNHQIRKIVIATGVMTTFAGSTTIGSTDGLDTAARFWVPTGITTDLRGNLYVVDQGYCNIRKIVIATGAVTTLAGTANTEGSADGTGSAAQFHFPYGVAADSSGNLYVSDSQNNEVRKIVISTRVVTTLAGNLSPGSADGTGLAAGFNTPTGITYDGNGNLYVTDVGNNEIRKIETSTGMVTTVAGSTTHGTTNGIGSAARFYWPADVTFDMSGDLYVADGRNNEIRKISGLLTGIASSNQKSLSSISIYPNPTTGIFQLLMDRNNPTESVIEIYNTFGDLIYKRTMLDNAIEIDLNTQPKGIYFYRVVSENKLIGSGKLVIE